MKITISIKKAQTALEYIAAAIAFSTVGIASFLAINQAATLAVMGEADTYHSTDTVIGKGLADGVSPEEYEYPSLWSEPQPELGGVKPEDTVQKSKEHTSDWDDAQEQDWVKEASERDYWAGVNPDESLVDFQPTDKDYTKEELQKDYSDYTKQWLNKNSQGYDAERKQEINEALQEPWFISAEEQGE